MAANAEADTSAAPKMHEGEGLGCILHAGLPAILAKAGR